MMTSEWVCSSIGLREWDRLLSSSLSFLFNEDENHHPYIFFFSFPRPRKDDDTRRSSKRNIEEQRDDHHPEITTTEGERKRERKNGQKEFDSRENLRAKEKKRNEYARKRIESPLTRLLVHSNGIHIAYHFSSLVFLPATLLCAGVKNFRVASYSSTSRPSSSSCVRSPLFS